MEFRENIRSFTLSILGTLSSALEFRFPFLHGHSRRVRDLSVRAGEHIGLNSAELASLATAADLHDVGIVGIPGIVVGKKQRLTDNEMELARRHPVLAAKLLEGVAGLESARRTILEHHENFDGSGYPQGLQGQDISISARILSVAELYDSVVSDRPYRSGIHPDVALEMIRNGVKTLFDPEVANVFLEEIPRHHFGPARDSH